MEEDKAEWDKAVGAARAEVAKDVAVWEEHPPPDRVDFVCARNVGKKNHINEACPVSSGNARIAGAQ